VTDLIDTTEMYLKTIFELEEEGIVPLRARIAERLHQSGPTVSQTVARMERDGLLTVEGDRHLELTLHGSRLAMRVMRKHRLAERLLTDVIGLDFAQVHTEACRWEHVMSDEVEQRLVDILDHPTESPYGNPIPGLDELGAAPGESAGHDYQAFLVGVERLDGVAAAHAVKVAVVRIGEPIQTDETLMAEFAEAGLLPGESVTVQTSGDRVLVETGRGSLTLRADSAAHVFVRRS
jgi:DtxR family Mn-dependent transcriptional regulator